MLDFLLGCRVKWEYDYNGINYDWVKLKERTKIVAGLVEFLSLIIMMAI